MTSMFPPSLPSAVSQAASYAAIGGASASPAGAVGGAGRASGLNGLTGLAGSGRGEDVLLRAEVEPEARGLGVLAHAERVLAALAPSGAAGAAEAPAR